MCSAAFQTLELLFMQAAHEFSLRGQRRVSLRSGRAFLYCRFRIGQSFGKRDQYLRHAESPARIGHSVIAGVTRATRYASAGAPLPSISPGDVYSLPRMTPKPGSKGCGTKRKTNQQNPMPANDKPKIQKRHLFSPARRRSLNDPGIQFRCRSRSRFSQLCHDTAQQFDPKEF